jgi:hypothetical protein
MTDSNSTWDKIKGKARSMLSSGEAGKASDKEADYRARQKAALDDIDADTSKGKDAGELGASWDDTFKKESK